MPPKFGGTEKCASCNSNVYQQERTEAGGLAFHKTCFKCSVCKISLNLNNYKQADGQLFCKNHFQQNVVAKNTQTPGVH